MAQKKRIVAYTELPDQIGVRFQIVGGGTIDVHVHETSKDMLVIRGTKLLVVLPVETHVVYVTEGER